MEAPKKKDFRPRAHANPFRDILIEIPKNPNEINWSTHFKSGKQPDFLDIGCGYGKFSIELSKKYEDKNICGLEIRESVAEFVKKKIESEGITNLCVFHTNAMIFLPNYIFKESIEKIFILFPDPHFKKKKQKARIVSYQTTHIFDYLLKDNGRVYISTDIEDLFMHMCAAFENNIFFKQMSDDECLKDDIYELTYTRTNESMRAAVKTGKTFKAIFQKININ